MIMTDEKITAWIKGIIFQNKRAKIMFEKIVSLSDVDDSDLIDGQYTVISVKQLESLKKSREKLLEIKNIASNMVKLLGLREKY